MSTPKHTHITSTTPNRTRIKVSHKRRNAQEMERLASALQQRPQVQQVRTNIQTGSITLHHSEEDGYLEDIKATLQDLGVIFGTVVDIPIHSNGKSEVAADLTHAMADLNQRVGQATDGVVDLRLLMPLGLGGLAVWQLLRNGLQFEAVPWYVLAWYSFDSFIKLHYTTDPSATKEREQVSVVVNAQNPR